MKKGLFLAVTFSALFRPTVSAQCNTLPDDCSTACNLGSLPLPAACSADSGNSTGAISTYQLTNVGAAASSSGTPCVFPAADVWYTFVATGTQLDISLSSATLMNPYVVLYQGASCNNLVELACASGSNGALSQTFSPITPGATYYLEISGGNPEDQGAFTLNISNDLECDDCLLGESFTASPLPSNGTYKPGQTVSFCYTVTNYNKTALNWLHGIVLYFGAGWDTTTLTPTYIPPSCAQVLGAHWGFYERDSGTFSHIVWGPGFYYETSAGSLTGGVDNNPGDNYGDAGVGSSCPVTFCWNITTDATAANSSSLCVKVKTTGDSESGSWTSPGCGNDPIASLCATISTCSPPVITDINSSCGLSNGITIAQGVGTAPYRYIWQNSAGVTIAADSSLNVPDTLTHLAPGQYFLNVTDSNGCSKVGVAVIGGQRDTFSITASPSSCFGSSSPNGKITLIPLVPQNAPFLYSINGAAFQGNNTFSHLASGAYTIVTKNTFDCFDTIRVSINQPAAIRIVDSTNSTASCNTGGYIKVLATGGTGTLLYSWSDAKTGDSIGNLAGGRYILTVTDQNMCMVMDTFQVQTAPGSISLNNPVIINDSCNGMADGSITASATGGAGTLHYSWNINADTTAMLSNLPAGPYSLTVTDGTGCSATVTYLIQQPSIITIDSVDITPVYCAVNGSIFVMATGGTGPLTYSWTGNRAGDSIGNLVAGNYLLTVTDQNSCSATATYAVGIAPDDFTLSTPDIKNVTCNNDSNGQITATTTGGAGRVRFQWSTSTGDTTATITNLQPGSYLVTATDGNGCTAIGEYAVANPPGISLGSAVITPAGCNLGGSIVVSGYGGTGLLTYSWSDSQTGDSIANLAGGDYVLTVTDQNLCNVTSTYHVDAASGVVTFGDPVITNIRCFGNRDGSITAIGMGGTGPVHYLWSNTDTGSVLSGLKAGTYEVTATDSVGCSASVAYTVSQPAAITISNTAIIPAACTTGGAISITVSGGTGALALNWSNGDTGDSIGNIAADSYTVIITDQNSCTDTAAFTVPPSQGGIALNSRVTPVSCHSENNGSIVLNPTGGAGAGNYHWSPAENNSDSISGLAAGIYYVTITDTGNCSAVTSYVVTQPAAINANLSYAGVICYSAYTESASANPTGGNGSYTFAWTNGDTSATVTNLVTGTFAVTITDSKNCSVTASGSIVEDEQIHSSRIYDLYLCAVPPYGNATFAAAGGTVPFTYYLLGDDTNTTGYFPNLPPGNYSFAIVDSLGCSETDTFSIPQGASAVTFSVLAIPANCFGAANGEIIISPATAQPGTLQYALDGGSFQTDSIFTQVAAGNYNITIQNTTAHCTYDTSAEVTQPPAPPLSISPNPDTLTATKKMDTISVSTGFNDPVFSWSPGGGLSCNTCGNPVAGPDSSMNYYLKVYSDGDSGCYKIDTLVVVVIPEITPDSLVMPSAFTPNGDGINDFFGPVMGSNFYDDLVIKEFRIYNRYGQVVHNSTDYWDGKFKGAEQPVGTYVYYIEVQYADPNNAGREKTAKAQGAVTLLR